MTLENFWTQCDTAPSCFCPLQITLSLSLSLWGYLFWEFASVSFFWIHSFQQLAQVKFINLFNFIDQLWVFFGPKMKLCSTFTLQSRRTYSRLTFKSMRGDKYLLCHLSKVTKVQFIVANYCAKNLSLALFRFLMNKHFLSLTIPETNRPINRQQ